MESHAQSVDDHLIDSLSFKENSSLNCGVGARARRADNGKEGQTLKPTDEKAGDHFDAHSASIITLQRQRKGGRREKKSLTIMHS